MTGRQQSTARHARIAMGSVLAWLALAALAVTNGLWWRRTRGLRAGFERERDRARETEARLHAELERDRTGHEAVLDCMAEGLLILQADGRVRLVNEALRRLFALEGEARGRTLLETVRRHELQELAERARREGQALGLELELDTSRTRFLEVNATTFGGDSAGNRGVILVFHEVTRLKELERTRREFVANVSHELRTPLALIKGFVETLIDGARRDPDVCLRFLQTIAKHTNRLTFLIEDLLTISQIEGGQVVMNRRWGELHPLVARVLEDLAAPAAARSLTLLNRVPETLQLRVDLDRLQQVLFNLVDNAIKYGRTGGTVTVGATPAPPEDAPVPAAGRRHELWVADDGPGIPPEALDRVFERFYRVDAARSREQGGTGLGLSIVKHIVQAHGGEVRAESEPGHGVTFRIFLP